MKSNFNKTLLFVCAAMMLQSSVKAQVVTTMATGLGNLVSIVIGKSDTLYAFSQSHTKMYKIDPMGTVSSFVGNGTFGHTDGTGTGASFGVTHSMIADAVGNIFTTDATSRIRKITPAGVVTTLVTSGIGLAEGITWGTGDTLIVNDYNTGTLYKVNSITGAVRTFITIPNHCNGLVKGKNDTIYAAGYGRNVIFKINPLGGIDTLAGSVVGGSADGTGTAARFKTPTSITTDAVGNLYVTDNSNNKIRKITPTGVVTTFAGSGIAAEIDGTGASAAFNAPIGITISATTGNLFVADYGGTGAVRKVTGGVSTKIENIAAKSATLLSVYPSPFADVFTIVSPYSQNAQLINMQGQIVQLIALKAGLQKVSAVQLPKGIYYLQSEDGAILKVLKE